MQYIYTRVSTDKQDTSNQLSKLKELFPKAIVVEEIMSGSKHRPLLNALLAKLNEGDELIIAALDRLGRRTSEVLLLIEDLDKRHIILKSIREGLDYSTIAGKLVTQILCAVAEMERGLISERTKIALAARRKAGIRLGPPFTYSAEIRANVASLREAGHSIRGIAALVGMSASRVAQLLTHSNGHGIHALGVKT